MVKTGLYFQDPKYQVRLGGKADFIFDPSLVLYLPLHKLDVASFMSKDAYGHLCSVTGALWTPHGRSFDGVDDYIEVPDHPSLDIAGDGSLEFWFKATSWMTGAIVIKGETSSGALMNYAVWSYADGIPVFIIGDGVGSNSVAVASALSIDIWYHLLVTWDGSKLKLYLDGLENNSANQTRTPAANTDRLLLGWSTTHYSNVIIGEVRIYNRVLTPLETQGNYLATKWRYR